MPRNPNSTRKPPRTYELREKEAALELGFRIGMSAAARQLGMDHSMLFRWRRENAKYWNQLVEADPAAQQVGVARRLDDLAQDYMEAEEGALARAQALLDAGELDAKELAALIKSMGSSRGLAAHGARQIRGEDQPTLTVNVNFAQLERAMAKVLDAAPTPEPPAIEGTATDA